MHAACVREGKGVYFCHAGLIDFAFPITLNDGTVLGNIIGGQVLPQNPDEEAFRRTARELGIDEEVYIQALQKVTVKTPEEVDASAKLLGDVINMFVRTSYADKLNKTLINEVKSAAAKESVKKPIENTFFVIYCQNISILIVSFLKCTSPQIII